MVTVYDHLLSGRNKVSGEVGIEIELEGKHLPTRVGCDEKPSNRFWRVERDGSLRGEAYEYVLAKPVARNKVPTAIEQLWQAFIDNKTVFEDSGRAGVHVHINVQKSLISHLINFIVLYVTFERVLVRFCGEKREGNLFCLRACDAEYMLLHLRKALSQGDLRSLATDDIRYASINLSSIFKYGSLEFRAMRSPVDPGVLEQWVGILLSLKDASGGFESAEEILNRVSQEGPEEFARNVFGEYFSLLRSDDWTSEVYHGLRSVQPIAMGFRDFHNALLEREEKRKALRKKEQELFRETTDEEHAELVGSMMDNGYIPTRGRAYRLVL